MSNFTKNAADTVAFAAAALAAPLRAGGISRRTQRKRLRIAQEALDAARQMDAEAAALPRVYDYRTGAYVRRGTAKELAASIAAAELDGGGGVITINGRDVYVRE